MKNKMAADMLTFIEKSPSAFHAIANLEQLYTENGYQALEEKEEWNLANGGKYYVTRNGSALIAFEIPQGEIKGFHMTSAHSDSPTFKVKENPEMLAEDQYVKLNTEKYGGMILSTWLDRPLSVAGRVTVKEEGKIVSKLVNIDKDLLVIPNLAIHMNREINSGMEYNPQVDMLPLYGAGPKGQFMKQIAKAAKVKAEDILSHDLFLYVRDKGRVVGKDGEYILSPKLDDLQCVYASARAMVESKPMQYINVCVVFDNEEVGSGTKQGADSTLLTDTLVRIKEALGKKESEYLRWLADSFMISADNGHAVHPNRPEKADPTNRPYLNGGIVVKYHGSQKYATDALSAAVLKDLCKEADVPCQSYTNRSDIMGGSTLGNISTAHVSVPTVDIGLPQLAMHSAVETGGVKDTEYAVNMFKVFFGK